MPLGAPLARRRTNVALTSDIAPRLEGSVRIDPGLELGRTPTDTVLPAHPNDAFAEPSASRFQAAAFRVAIGVAVALGLSLSLAWMGFLLWAVFSLGLWVIRLVF